MSERTAIVFYCKVCKGLFFAAVNNEHIQDDARDIARYIKEGHRMAEVPVEEVRSCQWCTCNDDEQANTSSTDKALRPPKSATRLKSPCR